MSNYQKVAAWLHACGLEPGNEKALSVQIGVHIEEFVEFLGSIGVDSEGWQTRLTDLKHELDAFAFLIKRSKMTAGIIKPLEALDAICDCDVTGNGVAYLAGFDKDAADAEVQRANWSKFDANGKPVILEGGKIGKSDLYVPPNLNPFLGPLLG